MSRTRRSMWRSPSRMRGPWWRPRGARWSPAGRHWRRRVAGWTPLRSICSACRRAEVIAVALPRPHHHPLPRPRGHPMWDRRRKRRRRQPSPATAARRQRLRPAAKKSRGRRSSVQRGGWRRCASGRWRSAWRPSVPRAAGRRRPRAGCWALTGAPRSLLLPLHRRSGSEARRKVRTLTRIFLTTCSPATPRRIWPGIPRSLRRQPPCRRPHRWTAHPWLWGAPASRERPAGSAQSRRPAPASDFSAPRHNPTCH
mmetsp:Transcript_109716/g.295114  ORF Transcript_109716/g.295114 Transcript_109716/m.295114 type:complete len:255 (-) Transcript_109716:13-777(-)